MGFLSTDWRQRNEVASLFAIAGFWANKDELLNVEKNMRFVRSEITSTGDSF